MPAERREMAATILKGRPLDSSGLLEMKPNRIILRALA